jgi:hypothetical protein
VFGIETFLAGKYRKSKEPSAKNLGPVANHIQRRTED